MEDPLSLRPRSVFVHFHTNSVRGFFFVLKFTRIAAAVTAASLLAACGGHSGTIPVQSMQHTNQAQSIIQFANPRPMFTVIKHSGAIIAPPAQMPNWAGSFKYSGNTYHYTMLGTNPGTTNKTTTIPVEIIPIKVTVGSTSFDPLTKQKDGKTAVAQTVASPIYSKGVTFKSGGKSMGNTQYLDAFQRGNFWSHVSKNTAYHILLGAPKVQAEQTIAGSGEGSPFGVTVGYVDINVMDSFINNYISAHKIPPTTLPVFMTYDVYLTSGGCCIGGYHSEGTGGNTYMHFTYINNTAGGVTFSQDVGALSHETGEWIDDPFIDNNVACGILEVGDPLEGDANYGMYNYSLGGFTYHLQDLVYLPYFGAPPSTSVNKQFTFQGTTLGVCSRGGIQHQ